MIKVLFATGNETKAKRFSKGLQGYPLNTISINKKLNKYFTDITEEDKVMLHEDESVVVDFIANSIKD